MALEFIDGFDHYTTQASLRMKWDSSSSPTFSSVAGRYGGLAVTGNSFTLKSGQIGAVATRTVGFAIYLTSMPAANTVMLQYMDAATEQISVRSASASLGTLLISRNGTTLATSTSGLTTGAWHYIEFQATIGSGTAGSYTLKVDGVTWLTASGVNTQASANATTNILVIYATAGSTATVDDVYVLNSTGSVNNTFLGDSRVVTALPNADGTTDQWTPSSGTDHYSRVNQADPDGDTSYEASATVGQIDTFGFPAAVATGAVAAVQIVLTAREDDAGPRSLVVETRSGGVNRDGAVTQNMSASYLMFREILENDPNTSAAWTLVNVNAAEFGMKVLA